MSFHRPQRHRQLPAWGPGMSVGRLCVSAKPSPRRSWGRLWLACVLLLAAPGCSLVYVRPPQPQVHPLPECTASVAAPVTDTVLAVLSVTLLGLGAASVGLHCPECGFLDVLGLGAVLLGTATSILFTTSAVLGYQRTGACRAAQKTDGPAVA